MGKQFVASLFSVAGLALLASSCSSVSDLSLTTMDRINDLRGRAPIVEVDRKKLRQFRSKEELVLAYQSAVRRQRSGDGLPDWVIAGGFDDTTIPDFDEFEGTFSVLPDKPE